MYNGKFAGPINAYECFMFKTEYKGPFTACS